MIYYFIPITPVVICNLNRYHPHKYIPSAFLTSFYQTWILSQTSWWSNFHLKYYCTSVSLCLPKLTAALTQSVLLRTAVSFLDIPDLASLAQISPILAELAADPVLHHSRIWVVAPSRVSHSLFGQNAAGVPLRPTVADLVHRGIMRGIGIERRWRNGMYFYSQHVSSPPLSLFFYFYHYRFTRHVLIV